MSARSQVSVKQAPPIVTLKVHSAELWLVHELQLLQRWDMAELVRDPETGLEKSLNTSLHAARSSF